MTSPTPDPRPVSAEEAAAVLIDAAWTDPGEHDIIHAYEVTGNTEAGQDWSLDQALCLALQAGAERTWQPGPARHDLRITAGGRTVCFDARAPLALVPAHGQ